MGRAQRKCPLIQPLTLLLAVCAAEPCRSAPPDPARSEGIVAILVADTATGPRGTQASEERMLQFADWVREMGIDVETTRLRGAQVSPGSIVATIRGLDPNRLKTRTLLFYYAGHGGTDPRTGHFLRTPGRLDLSRATLVEEIRRISPRLALVITDCCSTEATARLPSVPVPQPPERRVVEDLLLRHRGIVDINGSSYIPERGIRQAAFYHPHGGGLFTAAFTIMFEPEWFKGGAEGPDDAPVIEGLPGTIGHARRFRMPRVWGYDGDKDGFLDWSEAVRFLGAELKSQYEIFRDTVASGQIAIRARAEDVELLMSQPSQDPQVFRDLPVRSDRAAPPAAPAAAETPRPARKMRIGAHLVDRASLGGGYVLIAKVDPRSPATRAYPWNGGRKEKRPVTLPVGLTIVTANHHRVTDLKEFFRVLDTIPEGGELNIAGYHEARGRRATYEATVVLDRFE